MGDGVRSEKGGGQVVGVAGFPTMRSKDERVYGSARRDEIQGGRHLLNPRARRQAFKLAIFAYM